MTSLILSLAMIGQYPDTRDMMRHLQTDINANSIARAQPAKFRSTYVFSYDEPCVGDTVIIIGTDPWINPVVNVAEIRVSCGQLARFTLGLLT